MGSTPSKGKALVRQDSDETQKQMAGTMKAIVVHEFGGPEVLRLEEAPTPRPAAGQVLVRIHGAGVNPYDTYMRNGTYAVKPPLPYTPGSDGAGIVEAVGAGVNKMKPGDRVYTAKTLTGAYAEYTLTLESQVHPLPAKITYAQGAGVWVPYGTAYHALYQCTRARAGETLLVHGASGGVGIAAVQIARAMGMTVLGTAGTEKGLELAKREGANHVFNHTQPGYQDQILKATSGQGVSLILEMFANVNLGQDLKLLAPQGRVVVIGSRGDVTISPRDIMTRRGSIHAFTLWGVTAAEEKEIHAGLIAGMENGTLRPVVRKELPLAEAPRAHKEVLEPGAYGKTVLVP
ncbi:MAG TPA: NADPH:quinone reductase [Candidatus Acidoferrales bacterium]|nr:NADPH:quinone reductase [Candidatus Acidoferrales bacterium]